MDIVTDHPNKNYKKSVWHVRIFWHMWLMRVMRIGRCICMANPYSWLCQVHCGHGHSHGQETDISQVFLSFWRLSVGYSKSVFVFVLAFVFLLVLLFLIIKGLKLIRLLFVYQLSKHRQWLTEWVTQWQGNIYWAKNAKYEECWWSCCQWPARVSIPKNSRELFLNFTSRSQSRVIFISLSLLDLDFQSFPFHKKSEKENFFTLSREIKSENWHNIS